MMKFEIAKPKNYITIKNDDGTVGRLMIDDNGKLLYNDKELESLDDHKEALKILLRAVVSIVHG